MRGNKIVIPNAYLLYTAQEKPFSQDKLHNMQFYCMRFIWLLDPGDVILLPLQPSTDFIEYFARIKNIDLSSIHIFAWQEFASTLSQALANRKLCQLLKQFVTQKFFLQTCFYNRAMLKLADYLGLSINTDWKKLINNNHPFELDSKIWFRKVSKQLNIPIAEGCICASPIELNLALSTLLSVTGLVIIKRPHSASGKGNIGVSVKSHAIFYGTAEQIIVKSVNLKLAENLWAKLTNNLNHKLIVEVYYPHTGVFTAQAFIDDNLKQTKLFACAKIKMADSWYGVDLSGHDLTALQQQSLQCAALKFAKKLHQLGYRGYFCCDAIRLENGTIVLTEINLRPGAETPAYVLAKHFFGHDYEQKKIIITRKNISIPSFKFFLEHLTQNDLHYKINEGCNILVLGVDEYHGLAECLFIANNVASINVIEQATVASK